jgi:dTDP-4-dehydrorhamnose reductase
MIQFSTDCVFSGMTGNYADDAPSDVHDYYGLSKRLGEIADQTHVLTLRTSIIGHEAKDTYQLIDWFLSQQCTVKGYTRAIFSGFPTVEIAHILADHVLPKSSLCGTYNISADPISKHDLLEIVRKVYGMATEIVPDDSVIIDRSLNSNTLRLRLGYTPPGWPELVQRMRDTRPAFPSHT